MVDEHVQIEKEPQPSHFIIIMNLMKRSLAMELTHWHFRLSNSILAMLISISQAEEVLMGEQDWSLSEVVVVPMSI